MDGEIEAMLSTILSQVGVMLLRLLVAFATCMLAARIIRTALSRNVGEARGRSLLRTTEWFLALHALSCGWQQLDNGMFIAILYSGDFPRAALSVGRPFVENVIISLVVGLVLFIVGSVSDFGSNA